VNKFSSLLALSFILALCCSFFKPTNAQDFTSGYVIDLKGDTLKGRFFQSENQENYLQINFFLAGDPDYAFQHTPASIREYGFNDGSIYRSYSINFDTIPTDTNPLFLKVLINRGSDLSLLVFRSSINEAFYFFETRDGEIIYIDRDRYRTFLSDYSQDCADTFSKINFSRLQYNTKDLSDYVNRYNSCFDVFYDDDYSYLTDNIFKVGVNIGTGFGFIVHPNYTLDSPDLNVGFSLEKTKNKSSSILLELGFTKKSLTYESSQKGKLYVGGFTNNLTITELSTKSEIDLIALYANLEFKKTLRNSLYLIYGVGFSQTSNKSKGEYTIITTDQDIIDSRDYSFEAKSEFKPSGNFFSLNFGTGIPFKIGDLRPSLEARANYNFIKSSAESNRKDELGNKKEMTVIVPSVRYSLVPPSLPKVTLDLTLKIPVYSR
tara:strand:- start:21442 stop:22743 length:1302 start_codon:yes stop_codon:yes gene_type:complete